MKRTLTALALGLLSVAAFGDVTFNGMGPYYETATISGHLSGTFYSGLLNFSDPTNSCGLGTNFNSICVDLDDIIGAGDHWGVTCLDSDTLGGGLQAAGNIIANFYGSISSNEQASGLQLAAWEAVYDNGATADFANGNFKVDSASSGALAWAATYFNSGVASAGNSHYILPTQGSGGQAQMAPVPEPASIAVIGLGLIATLKRKRKRA